MEPNYLDYPIIMLASVFAHPLLEYRPMISRLGRCEGDSRKSLDEDLKSQLDDALT